MCPPRTVDETDEIGPFWTDEALFVFLESVQNKSPNAPLPSDVFADINPYLYEPSNLPENIWYLVKSDCPKHSEVGFWRVKDDSRPIYSDSSVIGWRTTLKFYNDRSPNGDQTDWLMHEYSIPHEGSSKAEGKRSLCRVFVSDKKGENTKMDRNQVNSDVIGRNNLLHGEDDERKQKTDWNHENDDVGGRNDPPHGESNERNEAETRNRVAPFPQDEDLRNDEHLANGDYLELADLLDPLSSSSSSENSSCVSVCSDMYFDSVALLHELGADDEVCQKKPSAYDCSISRMIETAVSLAPEGTSTGNSNNTRTAEPAEAETRPVEVSSHEKRHHEDDNDAPESAKRRPPAASEASSSRQSSENGKKADRGKTLKKFFCFLAF